MAAPRLAPASRVASARVGAGHGARHAHKSVRRNALVRKASGSSSKLATADSDRGARSLKATEEVLLDDDSRSSIRRDRADRSRPAGENRPANADHVRGIGPAGTSGKAARIDPAPERAAAAAMNNAWAHEAILAEVPKLRAFAISLCGNLDQADDF